MSNHRVPITRVAHLLRLGRSEAVRYAERLGFPVSVDGWVDGSAQEAIQNHIAINGNTEDLIDSTDPDLPVWISLWKKMSVRQRRALNRRFTKELETPTESSL